MSDKKELSNLMKHAYDELKYCSIDISEEACNPKNPKDPFDGYVNSCAKNAIEMLKIFDKEGHSGLSASVTLRIFNRLANFKNIDPLTNNPDEWQKLSGWEDVDWQNKRNPSCFTADFKTYHDLDDKENKIIDEHGYSHDKPKEQWVQHPLKDYKEFKDHK